MIKKQLLLILASCSLLANCSQDHSSTTELVEQDNSAKEKKLNNLEQANQWLYYLTDDLRKGRQTGSDEMSEVQQWLVKEFSAIGLTPIPGSDSMLQPFTVEQKTKGSLEAANVIGYLDCNCQNKKAIIIGAHYDHIGVNTQLEGDQIYNGADDDASGVVASLIVAKQLAKQKKLPFNIIIAAWDGEEKGLLGSNHFVENPLFPLSDIETGIMFELVGVPLENQLNNAWMTGFEYSTLYPLLQASLKQQGWTLEENPYPQMNLFLRSDNASFALMDFDDDKVKAVFKDKKKVAVTGIPVHAISVWRGQDHYHQVHDEAKIIHLPNLVSLAEAVAQSIINFTEQSQVHWLENSMFDFKKPKSTN